MLHSQRCCTTKLMYCVVVVYCIVLYYYVVLCSRIVLLCYVHVLYCCVDAILRTMELCS